LRRATRIALGQAARFFDGGQWRQAFRIQVATGLDVARDPINQLILGARHGGPDVAAYLA